MTRWARVLSLVFGDGVLKCVSEHGKFIDHHYHWKTVTGDGGDLGNCYESRLLGRYTCCRCGDSYLREWDF